MPWIDVTVGACDLVVREVAMANGRKVQPAEAEGLLREWKDSGERMSSWCGARGLSWYSLSAYKGWGAERATAEVGFAEIVVVPAHAPVAAAIVPAPRPEAPVGFADGPRYRVTVGEIRVEVDDDFRAETLQRLLRAVAAC